MLVDWLCSIFDFVIDFSSPSFPNGAKSKDGLGLRLGVIGLDQLDDGVLGIGAPSIRFDISLRRSLLHAHLWPSKTLALHHIVVLLSLNLLHLKFIFSILSKCLTIGF
jgi:hypothetical protein